MGLKFPASVVQLHLAPPFKLGVKITYFKGIIAKVSYQFNRAEEQLIDLIVGTPTRPSLIFKKNDYVRVAEWADA